MKVECMVGCAWVCVGVRACACWDVWVGRVGNLMSSDGAWVGSGRQEQTRLGGGTAERVEKGRVARAAECACAYACACA